MRQHPLNRLPVFLYNVSHAPGKHPQLQTVCGRVRLRLSDPCLPGGHREPALPAKLHEEREGLFGDDVLGIIEQYILKTDRELAKALGVIREEVLHMGVLHLTVVLEELLPGLCGGGICFTYFTWQSGLRMNLLCPNTQKP